jgi:F420-non-reducing hydrogenase small subunit
MSIETTNQKPKLKLAVYWGAACGGCCVSVLDVHETVLDIIAAADLVFWPIALDIKYKDVEAMPDGHIDLTLFNGAIRTSENEHMARLLRKKSKVMVAYGSCAYMGGIPGLANFTVKEDLLRRVYEDCESTVNPDKIRPQSEVNVPEGKLTIPVFYNTVKSLNQVVEVDYYIPGCPPKSERLVEVFTLVVSGKPLPPKGTVVGALDKTNCDDCKRKKSDNKKVRKFYRPWEIQDDKETCFLEQGIICMGPATRGGCGVRCVEGNSPCRGCYGPPPTATDPGAKMMSAIGTMIDSNSEEEISQIIEDIVDPAGLFYRFSLPGSTLRRKVV